MTENDWFDLLTESQRANLPKRAMPGWVQPMLATLADAAFDDPQWIYERKFDGERVLAHKRGGSVRLLSRNRKRLNDTYPELVDAVGEQPAGCVIFDGEVVAFSGRATSFERLQERMQLKNRDEARASGVAVYYYVFDVLYLEGRDITGLPLADRKRLLRAAGDWEDPVRYTAHRREHGTAFYREACRKGWEGVIAKDGSAEYVPSRSTKWLKFKCVNRQEFVVGGFTDPDGDRIGFGSLLIGVYDGKALRYAGRVGTGFGDDTLRRLRKRFDRMEIDDCPFVEEDAAAGRGVHWLEPRLVAEVGFTEWTTDELLRHPRFLGMRDDREPREVRRERPSGGRTG